MSIKMIGFVAVEGISRKRGGDLVVVAASGVVVIMAHGPLTC